MSPSRRAAARTAEIDGGVSNPKHRSEIRPLIFKRSEIPVEELGVVQCSCPALQGQSDEVAEAASRQGVLIRE